LDYQFRKGFLKQAGKNKKIWIGFCSSGFVIQKPEIWILNPPYNKRSDLQTPSSEGDYSDPTG